MSLDAALGIAGSGLAAINNSFQLLSSNIANANTQGYASEEATQRNLDAGGLGIGVQVGPAVLATDDALQTELYAQTSESSAAAVTQSALSQLQPALGAVGSGDDLGSMVTALGNSFSALLNDPASGAQQDAVVSAAGQLAGQMNSLSSAYGQARQAAQDQLVSGVSSLNAALGQVGALSNQIIALKAQGESTADLENQRNAALSTISGLVGARFLQQPNGDMLVFTASGTQLPTRNPDLSIATASTGPSVYYPGGGLPGIMLNGSDITSSMDGGSLGADLTLRDQTLPRYQAQLDEFADSVTNRFDAQGLTLFTDPQGQVPATGGVPVQAGYLGYAGTITVNPAVTADPSLVRDGTHAVTGSAAGASAFTPNPTGDAGWTDLIDRVVDYALGDQIQSGVAQPAPSVAGLGASGTVAAGFAAPASLGDFATALTSAQANDSASASQTATETAATCSALSGQLQTETGVNMDSQLSLMVQLQNAYGANAKIISAVQSMFNELMTAVSA